MAGHKFTNPLSSNGLRTHQNFWRQFVKKFIQAALLRFDQWSVFSPVSAAETAVRVDGALGVPNRHSGELVERE